MRGMLMSVLHTPKKRQVDVGSHLKGVLDQVAKNLRQDPLPAPLPTWSHLRLKDY